ncbi:MAG: hypothetical protein AAFR88_05995 [Pseudomonadota bacterium]
MALWIGGRALAWEDPFPQGGGFVQAGEMPAFVQADPDQSDPFLTAEPGAMSYADPYAPTYAARAPQAIDPWYTPQAYRRDLFVADPRSALLRRAAYGQPARRRGRNYRFVPDGYVEPLRPDWRQSARRRSNASLASAHGFLTSAALNDDLGMWRRGSFNGSVASAALARQDPLRGPGAPPFGGPQNAARKSGTKRWSVDAWGFVRAGSNSAPITQGRVPIYGASQLGAIVQWRARPSSSHDPRVYARAYRALVTNGETEVATGVSARPVGSVPLRAAAELRVTENPSGTQVRPAGYVVTEIPPIAIIEGLAAEVYAGGGYVGGDFDTGFVDSQFALTGPIIDIRPTAKDALKLSVGAGAWGGAQRDVNRLDFGPTMRLDVLVGNVPARVSLDWRERISGDASPDSGLAATVSASF